MSITTICQKMDHKLWPIINVGLPKTVNYVLRIDSSKARENFHGEQNKIFDLKKFRKCSIRKVYDSLHGMSKDYVEFSEIIEIMAYCLMDGKIDQKSEFETRLYNDLLEQLKNDKERF